MKKLIIRFLIIAAIFVMIDFLWGIFFMKITDELEDGRYYKAKYSLENTSENLLIFGSSLGETNYVSQIFEDSLDLKCYNTSRGSQLLPFFNCIKEATFQRYTPKYIILDIHYSFLETEPDYAITGEMLKPFYKTHKEIRLILNKDSKFGWMINLSSLYCYNSSYFYLLRPLLKKGLDGRNEDKGWKPLFGITKKTTAIDTLGSINGLNENALREFHQFTDSLLNKGTRLIFCSSPFYNIVIEETNTIKYVKNYATKHNIPFMDFSNYQTISYNNEYFKDPFHLNEAGALEFTKTIAGRIKRQMNINVSKEQL